MWIIVAVLIVTALWIVVGAVHGDREAPRDTFAGEAWWWESFHHTSGLAGHDALPPSHPLARPRPPSHRMS
jgi:hypothetical protein